MSKKLVKKVLLIGWDAADWGVIEPMLREGKMPALARLMENGSYGKIQTLDPPLSPMLWTSIATGVRADKHGIQGFIEPLPDGSGLRPVTSTSRKVKAIWNILNQNGYKSNVVAWWPSNPAEPINGVMVSNLYQVAKKAKAEEWPMPPGTVHPLEWSEKLDGLRIHPHEITLGIAVPFIPNLAKDKELRKSRQTEMVLKIIAESSSVHAAATEVMANTEWDLMAVYYDAIDHFSHAAMRYHPPKREVIKEEDFENYKLIVEAGYRFQDMMLERKLDLMDDDTTVILLSDHGFHSDHQRPLSIPREPSGPAAEHSPFGILVMSGPGIKKGHKITGASVIDITPTLLALFGLPVGKDMEGKVLANAFAEQIQLEFVDSWETILGESGQHDPNMIQDAWASQEAMQQLVELGYIEALDDDKMHQVEKAKRESKYYLARNILQGGKINEAIAILEQIYSESGITRYGQRLAMAYLNAGQYNTAEDVLERLKQTVKDDFLNSQEETKKSNPEDPFCNAEFEEPLLLDVLEGLILLAQNKISQAIPILEKVQKLNPMSYDLHLQIGRIFNTRRKYHLAERNFIKALAVDDTSAIAHHGLGFAYLRQDKLEPALDELLTAVDFNFFLVQAHYHLGETLARLQNYEQAVEAFEVAIRLSPGMTKAHKWLLDIYKNKLKMEHKAQVHEQFLKENIKGEIVVVSGLPRSGTSMMMQMLDAGGFPILSDNIRTPDDNNPKGYLEYQKVKSLHKDNSWIDEANGKAVKIIVQQLLFLPDSHEYKIIFMERDMDEVMMSQQKMLGKPVSKDAIPLPLYTAMQQQREKTEAWIKGQPNIKMLKINYKDVLENAEEVAETVNDFLGSELNVDAMQEVVDVNLHRNKVGN